MITGLDLRRYRKMVGLDQRAFAQRLGLTQSALSLMEIGKQPVSPQHLEKIAEAFDSAEFNPRFSEFRQTLEKELAQGQAALATPHGRFLTLTVWNWEPGFDLSRPVRPESNAGLVCIPFTDQPAIAFRMPQRNAAWAEGEILVFERCQREDLRENDLCLVQVKTRRPAGTKTMIAQVHLSRAVRGRAIHLEPLSPAGPMLEATDEAVRTYLRLAYRAREIH